MKRRFIPVTPAGTPVVDLEATTERQAIANLLKAAAHMPYGTWENFQKRGYTIEEWSPTVTADPVCSVCELRFSDHKTVISHDFRHAATVAAGSASDPLTTPESIKGNVPDPLIAQPAAPVCSFCGMPDCEYLDGECVTATVDAAP